MQHLDVEGVEAGLDGGRVEAEGVSVGDVIREGGQFPFEVELAGEAEVLPAREGGDLGSSVVVHGADGDTERGAEIEGVADGWPHGP